MYPFLSEAKAYARNDVTAGDVKDAVSFLRTSLDGELFQNPVRHVTLYALAKAMLACCSQATKIRLAEQKAREYVAQITLRGDSLRVGREFFSSLQKESDDFQISLSDYLKFGDNLVHQSVEKGMLRLSLSELNALLQHVISEKFLDAVAQRVPDEIRKAAAQLEPPLAVKTFQRKFLSLGCMQHISRGVDEGKRFYGSMGLSIAAHLDKLTREHAISLLSEYVSHCKGTHPFTVEEARSVMEWVYNRSIGFSCKQTMDNGFEGPYCQTCPLNWKRRKA